MKVVLVLGTSAGGVGRHVRMLAAGLAAGGAEVVVAGPAATQETFGFTEAGAAFEEVPIADRPHPVNDLKSAARLRAVVRGADTVHAHGLRAGALAAAAAGSRTRPGLVVTLHNAVTVGGAIGAVYRALEVVVARRADHVLAVSPDIGERMRARGARSVGAAVVPAPPLAAPSRDAAAVREEISGLLSTPLPEDRPVLLTIARLAQQKGLETLLDAAAVPYEQGPLFVVAGDGPLRAGLQARIDAGRLPVLLYGWASTPDLLQIATAVVVPSRWEGQPLNVQEALRAGKPVIATRVGGIPAMVGEAAVLVPPGDAAALSEAIGRVLGDPEEARRLGAASARCGAGLPDEDDAVRAVLDVYAALPTRQAKGSDLR
ncbi:glycosyl transferase [Planotetraspora thailandica]|uniref:Glycosyl transferase n=1 Tax=Planotetraspora thailandica TaxID=487172 RepID=A0A8J3UT79_9ACTN|nr:glycosyltransferase family 4 protein [Planotetraspora thailandica]GII51628.1 glycosyl transferase [Planotetraspora thailandica]